MIIKLPFPPSELMPNRKNGKHWGSTNDVKKGARETAHKATKSLMEAWKEPEGNIPLSILFIAPDKRHRDLDNLLAASKAALDGVAEALGVDDKRFKPIMVDSIASPGNVGSTMVAVNWEILSYDKDALMP